LCSRGKGGERESHPEIKKDERKKKKLQFKKGNPRLKGGGGKGKGQLNPTKEAEVEDL